MTTLTNDLHGRYLRSLRDYLEHADEHALQRAYDLGRAALSDGTGVLGIATLHHDALRELLPEAVEPGRPSQHRALAEVFFVESLMPFEMSHRSHREAITALRHMNDRIEEEAKRIAHALHDEAGGLLASTHLAIDELARELPPEAGGRLAEIRTLLHEVHERLRRLAHELRPTILDDLGLIPALDFLSKGIAHRAGLVIAVRGASEGRLPAAVETTLYRNVQEALNNVVRHAGALRVVVEVSRRPGAVRCTVRDDGSGFDARPASFEGGERGLGLVGIRERLDSLKGTLRIRSTAGKGTEILMQIPLEAPR